MITTSAPRRASSAGRAGVAGCRRPAPSSRRRRPSPSRSRAAAARCATRCGSCPQACSKLSPVVCGWFRRQVTGAVRTRGRRVGVRSSTGNGVAARAERWCYWRTRAAPTRAGERSDPSPDRIAIIEARFGFQRDTLDLPILMATASRSAGREGRRCADAPPAKAQRPDVRAAARPAAARHPLPQHRRRHPRRPPHARCAPSTRPPKAKAMVAVVTQRDPSLTEITPVRHLPVRHRGEHPAGAAPARRHDAALGAGLPPPAASSSCVASGEPLLPRPRRAGRGPDRHHRADGGAAPRRARAVREGRAALAQRAGRRVRHGDEHRARRAGSPTTSRRR